MNKDLVRDLINSALFSFALSLVETVFITFLFFIFNHVIPPMYEIIIAFIVAFIVTFALNAVFDITDHVFRKKDE